MPVCRKTRHWNIFGIGHITVLNDFEMVERIDYMVLRYDFMMTFEAVTAGKESLRGETSDLGGFSVQIFTDSCILNRVVGGIGN